MRKASQLYLKQDNHHNATLEHDKKIEGLYLVESWIVEDKENDKSKLYGMDVPKGTWMGAIKVENDEIWNDYVKEGKVKGFSIEGYFADKAEMDKRKNEEEELNKQLLNEIIATLEDVELETYNDYPEGAVNNAKRALKWVEQNGWGTCGEATGKNRANQIANREKLSRSTIARMASFKRHQQHKDVPYSEGCGGLMWDAWGGSAGVNWAISKLKEIDGTLEEHIKVNDDYAIIDDRLAYSSKEKAESVASNIGCEGYHIHDIEGVEWFMPCEQHMQKKHPKSSK